MVFSQSKALCTSLLGSLTRAACFNTTSYTLSSDDLEGLATAAEEAKAPSEKKLNLLDPNGLLLILILGLGISRELALTPDIFFTTTHKTPPIFYWVLLLLFSFSLIYLGDSERERVNG